VKNNVVWVSVLLVAGCVRLDVNPGNVVADTVDAGKNLYKTVKMRSNGQEEREYSHALVSASEEKDAETIELCFAQLKRLINSASKQEPAYSKQHSEISLNGEQRSVKCQLTAVITPK
jgi:hypothetical protein